MDTKKTITLRRNNKTFTEGQTVYKVRTNVNDILSGTPLEGVITKIGSTKVMATFGDKKVQFDLDLTKSYIPNEYFFSRGDTIISVEELEAIQAQSNLHKEIITKTSEFSKTVDKYLNTRSCWVVAKLAKSPRVLELIEELTAELEKEVEGY